MTKPKDNFDDVSLKIFKINCGIISDGEGAKNTSREWIIWLCTYREKI